VGQSGIFPPLSPPLFLQAKFCSFSFQGRSFQRKGIRKKAAEREKAGKKPEFAAVSYFFVKYPKFLSFWKAAGVFGKSFEKTGLTAYNNPTK
jgi:hypothetical protein